MAGRGCTISFGGVSFIDCGWACCNGGDDSILTCGEESGLSDFPASCGSVFRFRLFLGAFES